MKTSIAFLVACLSSFTAVGSVVAQGTSLKTCTKDNDCNGSKQCSHGICCGSTEYYCPSSKSCKSKTSGGGSSNNCDCSDLAPLVFKSSSPRDCVCPWSAFLVDGDCLAACPERSKKKSTGKSSQPYTPGTCEACVAPLVPNGDQSDCVCPYTAFFVSNKCQTDCPAGKKKNPGNANQPYTPGTCDSCASPLVINADQTDCVCPWNRFLLDNGSCASGCPSGSKKKPGNQSDPYKAGTCEACVAPLVINGDASECVCPWNRFTLDDGSCAEGCPSTAKKNPGKQQKPYEAGTCEGCEAPLTANGAQNECVCPWDHFKLEDGTCEEECPQGTTKNPGIDQSPDTAGTCGTCEAPLQANSDQTECVCSWDHFKLDDGSCATDCSSVENSKSVPGAEEYPDMAGSCVACESPLVTSTDGLSCVCPWDHFQVGDECKDQCPGGMKKIPGDESSPDDAGTCDSCDAPLAVSEDGLSCVCPWDHFMLDDGECTTDCSSVDNAFQSPGSEDDPETAGTCEACDDPLIVSSDHLSCVCPNTHYLYEGNCQESCLGSMTKSPGPADDPYTAGTCGSCTAPLIANAAQDDCICPNTHYLHEGTCDTTCPKELKKSPGPQDDMYTAGTCDSCDAPLIVNEAQSGCVCPNTHFWHDDTCDTGCPDGKKENPGPQDDPYTAGTCGTCDDPLIVTSDKTGCVCPNTHYLHENQCRTDCPSGLKMSPGPEDDEYTAGTCDVCEVPLTVGDDHKSCVCPQTAFLDGETCVSPCPDTGNKFGVPSTEDGKPGKCVDKCPQGMTPKNGICIACPEPGNGYVRGLKELDDACAPECGWANFCHGKCTDTKKDDKNCGRCGKKCDKGSTCTDGKCKKIKCEDLTPALTTCYKNQCKDLKTDEDNCGKCGHKCPKGSICLNGACVCPRGLDECNGKCKDLKQDDKNCGKCRNKCPKGSSCVNGKCKCPRGLDECNGQCKNLLKDNDSCGKCGNKCRDGKICMYGKCMCPFGLSDCHGKCKNLRSDTNNCGKCDKKCTSQHRRDEDELSPNEIFGRHYQSAQCVWGQCKSWGRH